MKKALSAIWNGLQIFFLVAFLGTCTAGMIYDSCIDPPGATMVKGHVDKIGEFTLDNHLHCTRYEVCDEWIRDGKRVEHDGNRCYERFVRCDDGTTMPAQEPTKDGWK